MRSLLLVIEEILKVAPDLEGEFRSLKSSIRYSAPELMPERWNQAALILNTHALEHEKSKEIGEIFSGVKS